MSEEVKGKKKIRIFQLIIAIIIPLAIGGITTLLIPNIQSTYESLKKPFFAPPSNVFPIV